MANSINTKAKEYYDSDNSGGSLNSNLKDFLKSQGVEGKSLNTMWRNYANNDGGVSLNTRLSKLWGTSGSLMSRWHKNLGLVWDDMKLFFDFRNIRDTISHASSGSTSFDGTNDYVDCGNISEFNGASALTFTAWVKFVNTTDTQTIISKYTDSNNRASYAIAGDTIYCNVSNGGGHYGTVAFTSTDWSHIVMVFDGSGVGNAGRLKAYIDGVEQTLAFTGTIGTTIADTGTNTVTLGKQASEYAESSLANVGIWSRALSASEVQGIMYKKYADLSSADQVSLVSWYGLDADYNDAHGSNNGTNNGSTLTASVYGGNAPSKPRILDSAPDVVDNYGTLHSGTALSFDGTNDEIDCGNTTLIRGGSACTFSFWMNSDDNVDARAVISQWNSGGYSNWGLWAMGSGIIQFHDGVSANLSSANLYNNDGNWYHVVVTKDGTAIKFYVDGSLHSSATSSGSTIDNNGAENTFIGSKQTGDYFDGKISSVKVFNSVLTLSEIQEMYLNPEQILPTGVASSNLKLWLPLQEGSGTTNYDGSGNNNDGTISGATWVKAETEIAQVGLVRQNKPMVFDGSNDEVDCGTDTLAINGDLTVSCWFKSDGDYSQYRTIIAQRNASVSTNYEIYLRTSTGVIGFYDGSVYDSSTTPTANIINHLMAVVSGTGLTIYLNGSSIHTATISAPSSTSGEHFVIGNAYSKTEQFDGNINEVAIWDEALTATEVTALYNSGTPLDASADSGNYASSDGLVGYWRNDGDTTWTDRSTNSNHGTVAGSPTSIVLTEGLTSGRDSQGFYLKDTDENVLTLNGAEYVEVPDSDVLDLTTSATWELWMNQDVIDTQSGVVGKGSSTANMITFYTWDDGGFYFDIRDGDTQYGKFDYSTAISADTWHHLTVVFDGSLSGNANRLKVYVDSVQQTLTFTGTIPSTLPTNTDSQFIGKSETAGTPFNGEIDEARIYSKALSSAEVLKNYNSSKSKHS